MDCQKMAEERIDLRPNKRKRKVGLVFAFVRGGGE